MAVLKYKDSNGQWKSLPSVMVNQINVVQTTGTSTGDVMSQNAVTENLHSHTNKTYLDGISGTVGTMAYEDTSSYSSATEVETALSGKLDTTAYTPTTTVWGAGTGTNSAVLKGGNNVANGYCSVAEGLSTSATSYQTHAEGASTLASNGYAHAEGVSTIANGYASHAEGSATSATSQYSHAEGSFTITLNQAEHASGQYNISSKGSTTFGDSGNTLFSVGNGTANDAKHNAFEIRQNGDIYLNDGSILQTTLNNKLDATAYTLSVVSAVTVSSDLSNVTCPDSITGASNSGAQAIVIYENSGTTTDYTITVSTSYKSPDGQQISITCAKSGYCEVNYLNINGTIYARGA